MFQFTGLPISHILFQYIGFPIRISRDLSLYATPPSFSQLITSFFGFYYLGILRVPLFSFLILIFFVLSQLTLSFLDSLTCSVVTFYLTIHFSLSYYFSGGDKRVRTADLRSASAALSQLSYIPIQSYLVGITGLEPVTPALSAQCSNHLSYTPLTMTWNTKANKIT